MRILLLVIAIILTSCNQTASGAIPKQGEPTNIPRLQRVWDEKYGVMCYFPMKQGTEVIVLEGMSCVQLEK